MGMKRDFTLGDGHTMQYADDVLLSCTLETCMILLPNVPPKNSIKKREKEKIIIGLSVRQVRDRNFSSISYWLYNLSHSKKRFSVWAEPTDSCLSLSGLIHYFSCVSPWLNYLTSLILQFLIFKIKVEGDNNNDDD